MFQWTEHWVSSVVKIEFEFYIGNDNTCQTKILKNNNTYDVILWNRMLHVPDQNIPSLGLEVLNVMFVAWIIG